MDYEKINKQLGEVLKEIKNPSKGSHEKVKNIKSNFKMENSVKNKSENEDNIKITWSPTSQRLIDDLSSNDQNLGLLRYMDYKKIDRWKKFIRMYTGLDENPSPSDPWYPMRYLNSEILESLYFNTSTVPSGMVRDVRLVCESLGIEQKVIRELQDEVRERCTKILRDSGQHNEWFI